MRYLRTTQYKSVKVCFVTLCRTNLMFVLVMFKMFKFEALDAKSKQSPARGTARL